MSVLMRRSIRSFSSVDAETAYWRGSNPAGASPMRFLPALFALLWTVGWLAPAPAAAQADYARERRWADEITPAILVGDPADLSTGG